MQMMNSQKGMTMIEILMVLGIMGITGFVIAAQVIETTKLSMYLKERQGFHQLASEIAMVTSQTRLCTSAELQFLPGQNLQLSQAGSSQGQDITMKINKATVGDNSDLANFGVSETQLRISNLQTLAAVNSEGHPLYQGLIRLRAKKMKSELQNDQATERIISSVLVSINNGQISGCFEVKPNASVECNIDLQTGLCQNSNASFNQTCPAGTFAKGYISGILQCQQIGEICSEDQTVIGISNGKVVCSKFIFSQTQNPNPPTSPGSPSGPIAAQFVRAPSHDKQCSHMTLVTGEKVCLSSDPDVLEQELGIPECTIPEINKKCFKRIQILNTTGGGMEGTAQVTYSVGVFIGIPLY